MLMQGYSSKDLYLNPDPLVRLMKENLYETQDPKLEGLEFQEL